MAGKNLNPRRIEIAVDKSSIGVLLNPTISTSELVSNGNSIPKLMETGRYVSLDDRRLIFRERQEFLNTSGNRNLSYFLGAKIKEYLVQAPAKTDLMVVLYNEDREQQVPTLKDTFWVAYYSKQNQ